MKILKKIAGIVFIIAVPLFCLTASLSLEIGSPAFYRYSFQKYTVKKTTGLSQSDLARIVHEFPGYFGSRFDYLQFIAVSNGTARSLFTETELIHFKDVKGLIQLDRAVMLATLAYFLAYAGVLFYRLRDGSRWLALGEKMFTGGGVTIVLLILLVAGILTNFSGLFLFFHELSLSNPFWSSSGLMPRLFPEPFWYDMALFTILFSTVFALCFGITGWVLVRTFRRGAVGAE